MLCETCRSDLNMIKYYLSADENSSITNLFTHRLPVPSRCFVRGSTTLIRNNFIASYLTREITNRTKTSGVVLEIRHIKGQANYTTIGEFFLHFLQFQLMIYFSLMVSFDLPVL